MATYITRPGGHDATYLGPYSATGVHLRLYMLDVGYLSLVQTVDRYLNSAAPSGEKFLPLGDRLVCCFAAMECVEGQDPTMGYMREIDVAFFIPCLHFKGLVPGVVFFAPYLFVDIPQAVATGREVHGYRKDFGTSFSDKDTYADSWTANAADLTHVEAWAIEKPSERVKRHRLVDVTMPSAPPAPLSWAGPNDVLSDMIDGLIGDVSKVESGFAQASGLGKIPVKAILKMTFTTLIGALLGGIELTVPIAFLRQFRDSQDSSQADVQEVVIANTKIPLGSLSGKKLPGSYGVTFHDKASHPFGAELGISPGTPIPCFLTADVNCQFTLEHTA